MNGTCEQRGSFKEIKTERIHILCIRKGEMKSPGTYIEERRLEEEDTRGTESQWKSLCKLLHVLVPTDERTGLGKDGKKKIKIHS